MFGIQHRLSGFELVRVSWVAVLHILRRRQGQGRALGRDVRINDRANRDDQARCLAVAVVCCKVHGVRSRRTLQVVFAARRRCRPAVSHTYMLYECMVQCLYGTPFGPVKFMDGQIWARNVALTGQPLR